MKTNFWMYTDLEKGKTAASLILYGAEVFKRAKLISNIDQLKKMQRNPSSLQPSEISEFIFNFISDCVKIIIFFENYMKAELINEYICVHRLNKDIDGFAPLVKKQYNEPIRLDEIEKIEELQINTDKKEIFHRAIKNTTIGMRELLTVKYFECYQLDEKNKKFIAWLNNERNQLHLYNSIKFTLSEEIIENLEHLNSFVDNLVLDCIKFEDSLN